jgi:hypothetical protein
MTLTVLQRAELEALGPATVRFKLLQGSSDRRAPISGFKYGNIMLADIEDWLVKKNVEEIALQQGTLRWAKIAGWAAVRQHNRYGDIRRALTILLHNTGVD